jgi:hypothetical protein
MHGTTRAVLAGESEAVARRSATQLRHCGDAQDLTAVTRQTSLL